MFNVLVDTTKQKMFHIKPAFEVEEPGFDFEKLLYWIVPILLIIGIVAFLFFRKRKRKKMESAKQLPPYEEAIEALKVLDHSHFLENDNSKSYYSSLTEILKRYIGREVDDAALESTSNELIDRLILHKDAGSFDFDAETINKIDKILKRADLIKFAKMKELEGQAKADRTVVEDIINETKSGRVFDYLNKVDLKNYILELYNQFKKGDNYLNSVGIDQYNYKTLSNKLSSIINKTIN